MGRIQIAGDGDVSSSVPRRIPHFADYAYPPVVKSNLTHLYFRDDDLGDFRAHLGRVNVTLIAMGDITITILDPDGQKVLFGMA